MSDKKLSNRGKFVRPCSKHNNITKSLTNVSKVSINTIPTVRGNEEVTSASHNMGDSVKVIDKPEDHKKPKKTGKLRQEYNVRFGCSKYKDLRESSSVPLGTAKDLYPKTKNSKSTPHVQKPNLEDSIDIIPVKLSSNNDHKQLPKEKCSGSYRARPRPTWNELLKSNSDNLPIKNKYKILSSGRNSETDFQILESVINTPKTTSRPNSVLNGRQDEGINTLDKCLHFPKSHDQQMDPVYACDPLKTLDFLIKQLREKITKKQENDHMGKIILDMENALLKISTENKIYSINPEKTSCNMMDAVSNNATKSVPSSSTETKSKNSHLNVAQLQKGLEESCLFLQSLCIKQKESCDNHIREKEQLTLQLAESRRLVSIATSREKDYEVIIGELRLKIQEVSARKDQHTQEVQDLLDIVAKLRNKNKVFKNQLETLTSEKENLLTQLSQKDLQIERLKVLLELKENSSSALIYKKNGEKKEYIENEMKLKIPVEDKENSLLTASTVTIWNNDKPALVCSSEASSSPRHSPSPYNSWQNISSICRQPTVVPDLNKDIAGIFQNLMNEGFTPLQLDFEMSSPSNSFSSDMKDQFVKLKFSDYESGTLSS